MDEQLTYVIKIEGHISERRAGLFGNMDITPLSDGHTLISGQIVDQSALFGILIRIRDLGMPLLSVNTIKSTNLRAMYRNTRIEKTECE